jgi:thiamine biosynthesis lipoprotein
VRYLLLAIMAAFPALTSHDWVERSAYLMGTTLRIRVIAEERSDATSAIESAFREVARWEDLLSTWRPDTELSRLNAAPPGTAVPLSPSVTVTLLETRRWSLRTEQAFDPAVGALIDAWDLRGAGVAPSDTDIDSALAATGFHHFRVDSLAGTATRMHADAWLDSGAFGKGLAVRAVRQALMEQGIANAFLDFGGQIVVLGSPASDQRWTISVAHPERRRVPVLTLSLQPGQSAATTSISERQAEVDGRRVGHVLDPRTGRPAAGWGSVTVVAGDPLVADVLSTALFVMGPKRALEWADLYPEVGVVVVPSATGLPQWSRSLDPAVVHDSPGPASSQE